MYAEFSQREIEDLISKKPKMMKAKEYVSTIFNALK